MIKSKMLLRLQLDAYERKREQATPQSLVRVKYVVKNRRFYSNKASICSNKFSKTFALLGSSQTLACLTR
jgi:hypothetical protein